MRRAVPGGRWFTIGVVVWCGLVVGAEASVELGDAAWARRADGAREAQVDRAPIGDAIAAYAAAIEAEPDRLEAYWKLMRALWFRGEFAAAGDANRRSDDEQARTVARRAGALVAQRLGVQAPLDQIAPERLAAEVAAADRPTVARVCFWSAIGLGAWARSAGLLEAVRAGVANGLHRYTGCVLALEPGVDDGGALRLLSRLHADLPRVPLLSGWVDRAESLPFAERAFALGPSHPGNAYVLALALLERAPARRAEALTLLRTAATAAPRREELIEDGAIRRDAAARLAIESSR